MEREYNHQQNVLFVVNLISFLASLSLFAFSFYILPYLLWKWSYAVPAVVVDMQEWYMESYKFSDSRAAWMVFLTFIVPALFCGLLSSLLSHFVGNKIYPMKKPTPVREAKIKNEVQSGALGFGFKVLILMILVLIGVGLVEWLVAPPSI